MGKKKKMTVETCGVELSIDPARLDDARFAYMLGRVQRLERAIDSAEADSAEREAALAESMALYADMVDIVFEDPMGVMGLIARANGGRVTTGLFQQALEDVVNAAGAKNSSGSQQSS